MRGKKKYCAAALMTMLLAATVVPITSSAATVEDTSEITTETPAFSSPAQAQHAANLAEQAATSDDSVQEAKQDVENARDSLAAASQSGDTTAIEAARDSLTEAESAYADSLADITGVVSEDITSMRDSGMGWGEIAHELGVDPGLLGLGHNRGRQNHFSGDRAAKPGMAGIDQQELAEATERDMVSGWSKGHGIGIQAGVHDPGTGLADNRISGKSASKGDMDHDRGGVSGAGGLGGRGSSGGSSNNSDTQGVDSNRGGMSSSGSGHDKSGGNSSTGSHDTAGPGRSGGSSNSGNSGSSSNSSNSGGSSNSGHSGGSSNSGNSGSSGGSGNSGGGGGHGDSGGHGGMDR